MVKQAVVEVVEALHGAIVAALLETASGAFVCAVRNPVSVFLQTGDFLESAALVLKVL